MRERGVRRWLGIELVALVLLLAFPALPGRAGPKEIELKSALLFRIAQFVSWPESAFREAGSPLTFGVIEDAEVAAALEKVVAGREIGGRRVAVRLLAGSELPEECHVLFIGKRSAESLPALLSAAQRRPILTVSDASSFAREGGIIQLIRRGKRIGFEIHRGVARHVQLQISAHLLFFAEEVYDGDAPSPEIEEQAAER